MNKTIEQRLKKLEDENKELRALLLKPQKHRDPDPWKGICNNLPPMFPPPIRVYGSYHPSSLELPPPKP